MKDQENNTSIENLLNLEMKTLPSHPKYAYLGQNFTLLVIFFAVLIVNEEEKLLRIVREYKTVSGWLITNIKGISHSNCMHKNLK